MSVQRSQENYLRNSATVCWEDKWASREFRSDKRPVQTGLLLALTLPTALELYCT